MEICCNLIKLIGDLPGSKVTAFSSRQDTTISVLSRIYADYEFQFCWKIFEFRKNSQLSQICKKFQKFWNVNKTLSLAFVTFVRRCQMNSWNVISLLLSIRPNPDGRINTKPNGRIINQTMTNQSAKLIRNQTAEFDQMAEFDQTAKYWFTIVPTQSLYNTLVNYSQNV